jgi:hypothetical protein
VTDAPDDRCSGEAPPSGPAIARGYAFSRFLSLMTFRERESLVRGFADEARGGKSGTVAAKIARSVALAKAVATGSRALRMAIKGVFRDPNQGADVGILELATNEQRPEGS